MNNIPKGFKLVPVDMLVTALKADASIGASAMDLVAGWKAMAELRALLSKPYPSEDELIASGLGYPFSKEEAVYLYYSGFRTELITVLEAWDAIGHDIGCNPSKDELLDSLRNMTAICNAHGNDMPAAPTPPQPLYDEAAERELFNTWYAKNVGVLGTSTWTEYIGVWMACAQSRAKAGEDER